MNTCIPNHLGIMVPGSTEGSDLSTSIAELNNKLRGVLLNTQKIDPLSYILVGLGQMNGTQKISLKFITLPKL